MFTADFVDFKKHIPDNVAPTIARLLASKIRPLIQDMFGEPELTPSQTREAFFTEVMRKTGDWTRGESEDYYDDLIKKWKSGKNRSLAISTYYYLHTTRAGQGLAESVDRSIFSDETFSNAVGHPVPGGYHEPNRNQLVALSLPSPIAIETLELVRELAAHKREGAENASIQLLISIAKEYGEDQIGQVCPDLYELRAYLTNKIEQWHEFNRQIEQSSALENYRPKLDLARAAIERGDFPAAQNIIISSRENIHRELNNSVFAICEHFVLQANVALLTNNQIAAAGFYDQAAALAFPIDPAQAVKYSHLAANELHKRSYRARDISKIDVARRYKDIMDRMRSIPTINDWQRFGPVMSYCGILAKIGNEGGTKDDIAHAESECRAALVEYDDNFHQLIPAIIRSVLAGIIIRDSGHGASESRLKEAIGLHEAALQVLTPSTNLELWRDAQMRYGLALMDADKKEGNKEFARKAIDSFTALLGYTDRAEFPEKWSRAQHNIGVCYRLIGISTRRPDKIRTAVHHLKEALLERSENTEPLLYARTKSVVALCYEDLYKIEGSHSHLALAIAGLTDTLRAWDPAEQKVDWHHYALRLVQALRDEAKIFGKPRSLENAVHLARYIKQYFKTDPARGGAHYPLIELMALLNPNISDESTHRRYLEMTRNLRINL
jgi:hypothetical protein